MAKKKGSKKNSKIEADKLADRVTKLNEIFNSQIEKIKKSKSNTLGGIRFNLGKDVPKPKLLSIDIDKMDIFLGGGFPKGRFTELYGDPGGGKTTMALQLVASLQKQGETGIWVDLEHKWSPDYAEFLGVDTSKIHVVRVDKVEVIFNALIDICKEGPIDFIVIDSIASGATDREGEDLTKANIASFALKMSEWLKRVRPYQVTNEITIICINQVRENITKMGAFGKKSSGGNAWHHEVYLSLYLKKVKKGTSPVDVNIRVDRERELSMTEGDIITLSLTKFGFCDILWVEPIFKEVDGITITAENIKFGRRSYPKGSLSRIGKEKITELLKHDDYKNLIEEEVKQISSKIIYKKEEIEVEEEISDNDIEDRSKTEIKEAEERNIQEGE